MLSSTALGFSIMSDRRSSSTRRRSLPKLARARRAETTIVPFLSLVRLAMNSPFQLTELYGFPEGQSIITSSKGKAKAGNSENDRTGNEIKNQTRQARAI